MKKIISILISLAMLIALPCALAEEIPVINWEDVDIESSGIEGTYYTFDEVAMVVWVPDVFENLEVTEEDDESMIGKFEVADGSAGIYVQYIEGSEGADLDSLISVLESSGAEDIERCLLNGLDAVSYTLPDYDAMYVALMTESGNCVQFVIMPMSDEGVEAVAMLVAASIQPEA